MLAHCGGSSPLVQNLFKNKNCRQGDLNPHGLLHTPLKRARIPIPPCLQILLIYLIVIRYGFELSADAHRIAITLFTHLLPSSSLVKLSLNSLDSGCSFLSFFARKKKEKQPKKEKTALTAFKFF